MAFKWDRTCSNIFLLLKNGLGIGLAGFGAFIPLLAKVLAEPTYYSRDIEYYSISSLNSSAKSIASIKSSPYFKFSAVLLLAAMASIFITLSLENGSI